MEFRIHLGTPQMKQLWDDLSARQAAGTASKDEARLRTKMGKTMKLIAHDPFHNGLNTHEITPLSRRYGRKVFQSYMENNTPSAGRMYWVYGPKQGWITIIGVEPHPNDKKSNAYDKVTLSQMGDVDET